MKRERMFDEMFDDFRRVKRVIMLDEMKERRNQKKLVKDESENPKSVTKICLKTVQKDDDDLSNKFNNLMS